MAQGWELLLIREDQSSDALNYPNPALGGSDALFWPRWPTTRMFTPTHVHTYIYM